MTIGAVVVSRNDNYTGDLALKFTYSLNALLAVMDEVYYIDWNSPGDVPLIDAIRHDIPHTGKLHSIVVTQAHAAALTHYDPDVQLCCEVLARNIGIRRLSTDYIVSTNSDVMPVSQKNIFSGVTHDDTFYTVAKTNIDFQYITGTLLMPGSTALLQWAQQYKYLGTQYGEWHNDPWSLISGCGDFQTAHRDIWYAIKGFEETMIYRWYMDSNVQRKADFYGYKQVLLRDVLAFHFNHYPGTGAGGGSTPRTNDAHAAMGGFTGTTNTDTWGFADSTFAEEII